MQGKIIDLVKHAGRHFLQLLKEYVLIRIGLFAVLCVGIAFLSSKGLGQQSQTFTAFSEGQKHTEPKAGLQEIKGLKRSSEIKRLNNPFKSQQGAGEKKAACESGKAHQGMDVSNKDSMLSVKAKESKGAGKPILKTEPVLLGILEGNEQRAAVIKYGDSQYILYAGDVVQDMQVKTISDDIVVIHTPFSDRALRLTEGTAGILLK